MSHVVALDVGGTSMKGGLVSESGEVTVFPGRPTGREDGPEAAIANIRAYVAELAAAGDGPPLGVGLAVPGIVDADTALYSANIGWRDVPATAFVPEGLPVCLGHDVQTAGLAESVFGAGRDVTDFLFLPIGTGIAGALIIRGEPYGGVNGWGGEIGHAPVWPDGERCACGQTGCLETYASAASLGRRYTERTGKPATAVDVMAQAATDPHAYAVLAEAVEALAISLVSYTLLMDPAMIVIGGGLGEAGEALLMPLRDRMTERLSFRKPPPLRQTALGMRAGMLGAGILGWRAAGVRGWAPQLDL
ncbi:ROK family protein [Herbidospora mongoliensis]|uniref:ROK family protein n=1 Tax=Herbidospora mongoliensis TaxID=688067 RepID=UPI0009FF79DB|nr:ROK family protein [Herbidospora mongoliensis]